MGLETANYISQLVPTNPDPSDLVSQGDDHLRMIKNVLKTNFPNLDATPVTPTTAELNYVDGVTSSIQTQIDAANAERVSGLALKLDKAGGTMTGPILNDPGLPSPPVSDFALVAKKWVNDTFAKLSGATFTGMLKMNLLPSAAEDLVNKQYADSLKYTNPLTYRQFTAALPTAGAGLTQWFAGVFNPATDYVYGYEIAIKCVAPEYGYAIGDITNALMETNGTWNSAVQCVADAAGNIQVSSIDRPRVYDKLVYPATTNPSTLRNITAANWVYVINCITKKIGT